jgi:hypothetical protein
MPSTLSSMLVRTSRIEPTPRATSPVIRPSRGPGPRPAPMYSAPASALPTMASASTTIRTVRLLNSGSTRSVASVVKPMMAAFATVPMPGRCRSGIQSNSTNTDTMVITVP